MGGGSAKREATGQTRTTSLVGGSLRDQRILVTGGAGFIGSHATESLVREGAEVTVLDNLSSGSRSALAAIEDQIAFVKGNAGSAAVLDKLLPKTDAVWHLAANPEVRTGATDPAGHFEQNVDVTFRLLEGMRRHNVKHLVFTSTSTVYGRATVLPTPEHYGPLLPISIYGACKLACEALIASYGGTFDLNALMFRFANVVGPRSNHGVAFDFVNKLQANPKGLEILGDGKANKSYVSVADTVAAMVHAAKKLPSGVHALNVGSLDTIDVRSIADLVASEMKLKPRYQFTAGAKDGAGWVGDVKAMSLAIDTMQRLGWKPQHSSRKALQLAVQWLLSARKGPPA
jgi:UDP-glucose 4-epimerase